MVSVLAVATFIIKKKNSRLAVDIRLIALIAMLVFWYISTEFEQKMNKDSTSLKSVIAREVCEKSTNLVKNRCTRNRWSLFSK